MRTPFTADQFLGVFRAYNLGIFPMQIVFYLLGIAVVYLAVKPNPQSGKIISGMLAFFWLWMGLVYHVLYFTKINKAAYLFGIVFVLQGILFIIFGIFKNKLSFKFQSNRYGITGISLVLFALIVYPITGYFLGHTYPDSPTFGLPCPTTIFTFGLLLLLVKPFSPGLLIIPLLWSVIGFMAVFQFGIVEDTGLLISGLITVSLLLIRDRKIFKKESSAQITNSIVRKKL